MPVLQPMWPAGIGGQFARWSDAEHAYIISEPTRCNHAVIGSPAARSISDTPAHMLAGTPCEFRIDIPDPRALAGTYIPICLAGGAGDREDVLAVYRRLCREPETFCRSNERHFRQVRDGLLRVHTPRPELNRALEWTKITYDNLIVDNPTLGKGMVAGLGPSGRGGRPGFGWYFGGDAYINSLALSGLGAFDTVRDVLAFTRRWQRADGKMAHELSQAEGYIDWFKDYPYAYIHGDTTPFYIVAMGEYFRASNDRDFVKESWESLRRAWTWCRSTDKNGDGLMDNAAAGPGGLEYGELTGIATDIYLAAAWTRAAESMVTLATALDKADMVVEATAAAKRARQAIEEKFWNETDGIYVSAFNADDRQVRDVSPWSALALMWGLGQADHSRRNLEVMGSAELDTDWGIRSISAHSRFYQPLNYNYGAVWPFLTGWVTGARFHHGLALQGLVSLEATARHTYDDALGCIPEVFSGALNIWPQKAVPQQGISSTAVALPLIRGLLGLDGDAARRSLTFAPAFPPDWEQVTVADYRLGGETFAFEYRREDRRVTLSVTELGGTGVYLRVMPLFEAGARVRAVRVNRQPVPFDQNEESWGTRLNLALKLDEGKADVELDLDPAVAVLPPDPESRPGDANVGLRIISVQRLEDRLELAVEGLAGRSYRLRVLRADRIRSVVGGSLEGDSLVIPVPRGEAGVYVPLRVILHLH